MFLSELWLIGRNRIYFVDCLLLLQEHYLLVLFHLEAEE